MVRTLCSDPKQLMNNLSPDPDSRPPRPPTERTGLVLVVLVAVALAGVFGWRHFSGSGETPPALPTQDTSSATTGSPPAGDAGANATDAPSVPRHPVEPTEAAAVEAPAPEGAVPWLVQQLVALLGREQVNTWVQTDELIRRIVATVDNLDSGHAAPALWPVHPTPGRFSTQAGAGGIESIHPANAARYAPAVRMATSVDLDQLVAAYRRLYPQFQTTYEALGYPGRYFNDRLVAVLDHLIATPVPAALPLVVLVEVKGPVPSTRPWVRYEFADPALARLSAGQKMLLRTGPDQQRQLQGVLSQLRARVARP
jgi:hypothetical protein